MRAPRKYRVKVKILRDRVSRNIKILRIDDGKSPAAATGTAAAAPLGSNAPRYNTQACALRNFETSITLVVVVVVANDGTWRSAGDVERMCPACAFVILEYENCPLIVDASPARRARAKIRRALVRRARDSRESSREVLRSIQCRYSSSRTVRQSASSVSEFYSREKTPVITSSC